MGAGEVPLREYLTPLLALDDKLVVGMRKGKLRAK